MIQLQQLTVQYPDGKTVLDRLTTTIKSGEMVIITGPLGAGKTTLLNAIALLCRPTSGSIFIDGQDITQLSDNEIPLYRQSLGMVFQDQKLLLDRTVLDNLVFPLEMFGFPRPEAMSRAKAALERVELFHKAAEFPHRLSGGEQKSLCIARAIINKPSVLLADEPLLNLDMPTAKKILAMLKTISQVGITVIVASHLSALVRNPQERMLRLDNGLLTEA